jgi:hypothetical protein
MGDLESIPVQQGDIEQGLELIITIIPDIGGCPLGFQEIVTLLPDPDGVGLDPGKVFQVFDGKSVHSTIKYNPGPKIV